MEHKIYVKKDNMNLQENIQRIREMMGVINEGLHDTSWQNDEGDKVTLVDLLDATEDIPVKKISVNKIKSKLLKWDNDEKEIAKIEKSNLKYPILIFVDDNNKLISIIDGHHRGQKAVRHKLKTIKAKLIPINSLPKDMRKVFSHMGRQEEMKEGELTEKCWKGYTQKGMKTMFGKRYPNCVKKTKLREESIRRILKEELNKPSEKSFEQALKDVMTLIPLISHRILHDENMEHNEETVVRLNKMILQKVKEGNDEVLDEMCEIAGSMIMKHAINIITHYTK